MLTLNDPSGSLRGWRCKPVTHVTGRAEQLADGSILVLTWPPDVGPPIQARLVYVPATWIVGTEPEKDDWK